MTVDSVISSAGIDPSAVRGMGALIALIEDTKKFNEALKKINAETKRLEAEHEAMGSVEVIKSLRNDVEILNDQARKALEEAKEEAKRIVANASNDIAVIKERCLDKETALEDQQTLLQAKIEHQEQELVALELLKTEANAKVVEANEAIANATKAVESANAMKKEYEEKMARIRAAAGE